MEKWATLKRISDTYGINISALQQWVIDNMVTYTIVGDDVFIDESSLIVLLNHNKVMNDVNTYLNNELKIRKEEIDRLIAEQDDLLYQLKTVKQILPVYKTVCYELAGLVTDPLKKSIFLDIVTGKGCEYIIKKNNLTFNRLTQLVESAVSSIKFHGPYVAGYRTKLMNAQLKVAKYEHMIKSFWGNNQELFKSDLSSEISMTSADLLKQNIVVLFRGETRVLNILCANGITTVWHLLKFGKENGFEHMYNFRHLGAKSYNTIMRKLTEMELIDKKGNCRFFKYL